MEDNIRILITNLGAYNEGNLLYDWLTLPFDEEDLQNALDNIGIDGEQYEEYFISDYEAPFSIGEYDNIDRLNEVAEALQDVDFSGRIDVEEAFNLAHSAEEAGLISDAYEHVGDIVDDEQLDEMVAHIARDDGWRRVRYFLAGIEFANEDYYWLNGYANAESLTNDRLSAIIDDIFDEIQANV